VLTKFDMRKSTYGYGAGYEYQYSYEYGQTTHPRLDRANG
jgi:hypothetical protein